MPWKIFSRGVTAFNIAMGYLSAVAIVVTALVLVYEVIVRYAFAWPTVWEIEFCIIALIVATFMGAAYTLQTEGHIRIEVLDTLLPARLNRWRLFVADVASLLFCALVAWNAWLLFVEAWNFGWVTNSMWAPKLWIPYGFMALGMSTLVLQYVIYIVERRIIASGAAHGTA